MKAIYWIPLLRNQLNILTLSKRREGRLQFTRRRFRNKKKIFSPLAPTHQLFSNAWGINTTFGLLVIALAAFLVSLPGAVLAQNSDRALPVLEKNRALTFSLTQEEQAWLQAHPNIRLGFAHGIEPSVIVSDDGKYSGIYVDFLDILNKRLGTRIELHIDSTANIIQQAKAKEVDGLIAVHPKHSQRLGLLSTKGYMHAYPTVFARISTPFKTPDDFSGKKIAIMEKVYFSDSIVQKYWTGGTIVKVPTALDGLQLVQNQEVDYFVGSSRNRYLVHKYRLSEITAKYTFFDYTTKFGMGIRADWPEFVSIVNKAISSFSEKEIEDIVSQWTQLPRQKQEVILTPEEQTWLAEHGPKVSVSLFNVPPLQIEQDGNFTGYQVDILDMVLQKAGLQPIYTFKPLAKVVDDLKEKRTEIALDFILTEERGKIVFFSKKKFDIYMGIFAQKKRIDLNSVEALSKAVIASYHGYGFEPRLKRHLPDAEIIRADDAQGMFRLVASGKADAAIHSLEGGELTLHNNLITNVISHGEFLASGESRLQAAAFVVRKDLPALMSIIDKSYASVEEAKKQAIWNKWFGKNGSKVKTPSIFFSDQERSWIAQKHTVMVRVADRPPLIYLDKGQPAGLAVDLIDEVSKLTGIQFNYVLPSLPFKEDLDGLIQHEGPDLILTLTPTKERENIINFTEAYISSPKFIFTRDNTPFVASLEKLEDKTVAVVDGFLVHDILARDYPKIHLLIVKSSKDALSAVSSGKAYAFIDSIFTTPAMINKFGFKNLKATAQVSALPVSTACMGIRNDWPELRDILNKAFDTIPPEKMTSIVNKWSTIKFDHGLRPVDIMKWVLVVAASASLLIFMFVFWNRSLAKQVQERTAALQYQATLLENVSDAVVSIDTEFRIISWNEASEKIYGWKAEEIMGAVFADVTAVEFKNNSREDVFKQIIEQGSWHGEVAQYRKDGAKIIIQATISVIRNKKGERIGYVGVNRDITEKKKVEDKLKKSEEYFSKAFYSQAVPMAIINVKSGERIDFNDSYIDLCGYSRKELQGNTINTLRIWVEPQAQEKSIEKLLREGVIRDISADIITKSGATKSLLGSAAMIEFGEGNLAITAWIDITQRKEAEEQIQQYQTRLKALASQLTIAEEVERSRIAAELHDHVGQALAFSHIQIGRAQRFAKEEKLHNILEEVSNELQEAIQDTKGLVFDLSSPLLHELGLTAAIAAWLEEHVSSKHGIETELIGSYKDLYLSRDLNSILFRNVRELLANVIKYSQATKVKVYLENTASALHVIVHDDGVGFEADAEASGSVSHSGFGLFSIRERLEDFGGSLDITSSPGKGCKVTMTIPINIDR